MVYDKINIQYKWYTVNLHLIEMVYNKINMVYDKIHLEEMVYDKINIQQKCYINISRNGIR